MLPDTSYEWALANHWFSALLLLFVTGYAFIEATPELIKNYNAYIFYKRNPDHEEYEVQSKGDFRRSAWFWVAFFISMIFVMYSIIDLAENGPGPYFEGSLEEAMRVYVFVGIFACFWRAKHADRRTTLALEKLARKIQREGRDAT